MSAGKEAHYAPIPPQRPKFGLEEEIAVLLAERERLQMAQERRQAEARRFWATMEGFRNTRPVFYRFMLASYWLGRNFR